MISTLGYTWYLVHNNIGARTYVVTKVIGWITQILEYVDKVVMGPRCTWLFLLYLICVDSIQGFSRCRGYWSILLSICRVCVCVCIYMFGWLCPATYCHVLPTSMLGVSHAVQNEKKLWKFTQSDRGISGRSAGGVEDSIEQFVPTRDREPGGISSEDFPS